MLFEGQSAETEGTKLLATRVRSEPQRLGGAVRREIWYRCLKACGPYDRRLDISLAKLTGTCERLAFLLGIFPHTLLEPNCRDNSLA